MSIPTCDVKVRLYDQSTSAVVGATVTAKLDRYEVYQGFVVPDTVTGVTDQFGECTLSLFPNVLGTAGSSYKIKITPADIALKAYSLLAAVPDSPTANLDEISEIVSDAKPDFQQFLDDATGLATDLVNSANAAKIAAQAAQTAAAGSATAADTSATSAGTQAAAALASSQSAQQSANDAAASFANIAAQAVAASASAAASADSAASASASAGTAATKAGESEASATSASGSAGAAAASAAVASAAKAAAETARDLAQSYASDASPALVKPGDASAITGRAVRTIVIFAVPITAPRVVTFNATNPLSGDTIRATRTAAAGGADLVDFGGGVKYLNPGQYAEATYDGSAWVLTAFGSL